MSITVSFKTEDWDDKDRAIGQVIVIDHYLYDKDPRDRQESSRGRIQDPIWLQAERHDRTGLENTAGSASRRGRARRHCFQPRIPESKTSPPLRSVLTVYEAVGPPGTSPRSRRLARGAMGPRPPNRLMPGFASFACGPVYGSRWRVA